MFISKYKTYEMANDLAEFETKNNIEIPTEYRGFLNRYNGGDTPNTSFVLEKEGYEIKAFYGVKSGRYNWSTSIDVIPFIKKDLLPIAFDSFGNTFAIAISEKNSGKVYFCDHETGNRSKLLSDSFTSFILGCVSKGISPNSYKTVEEREAALIAKGRGDIITDGLRKIWQDEVNFFTSLVLEEVVLS